MKNTRYVALEFGIHGFLPYRVPEIVRRGFGDCKDKASLIYTMLREAGVDARIVLVRTRRNGAIDDEPASLAVFDHAIAYVPSLNLFLDGTAEHSGTRELPEGDQGVMVLLVGPDRRRAREDAGAAARRATCARARSPFELTADGSGKVDGEERIAGVRRRALPQHLPGRGHAQGSPRAPALRQLPGSHARQHSARRASTTSRTTWSCATR